MQANNSWKALLAFFAVTIITLALTGCEENDEQPSSVAGTASAQIDIVRDGKVRAVVVTAAKPSQVAVYAVEELVNHV